MNEAAPFVIVYSGSVVTLAQLIWNSLVILKFNITN